MFVWNRIADVCFVAGLLFVWFSFGTFEYSEVLTRSTIAQKVADHPAVVGAICVCLFAAAAGKCAQFPTFVWLEESSVTPATANALLHSVTMLPAGIYLVARCMPLFDVAPEARVLMAFVGGLTIVLTGAIAVVQDDLRRILAFTSAGQFGLMFLALSTGSSSGVLAALFLLTSHSIAKSMLFLAAGDVTRHCGGVASLKRLGALRQVLPTTSRMFLVGAVILASGFWGQSSVLGIVWEAANGMAVKELDSDDGFKRRATHNHTGRFNNQPPVAAVELPQAGQQAGSAVGQTLNEAQSGQNTHAGPDSEMSSISLTATEPGHAYRLLLWVTAFGLFLTAFAIFRTFFRVFYGENREAARPLKELDDSNKSIWRVPLTDTRWSHNQPPMAALKELDDSNKSIWRVPLTDTRRSDNQPPMPARTEAKSLAAGSTALVVFSLAAILIAVAFGVRLRFIDDMLARTFPRIGEVGMLGDQNVTLIALGVTLTVSLSAGVLAWLLVSKSSALPHRIAALMGPFTRLGQNRFYLDDIFELCIVRVLRGLAAVCRFVESFLVEGAFLGFICRIPVWLGRGLQPLQNGIVQFYALSMILTVGVLLFVLLWLGN